MSLPKPTSDSTVLVTGASSGIGTELARELARRGYNVTLAARREELLRALAGELHRDHGVRADIHVTDLIDRDDRARLVSALLVGQLDVVGVCNNAGYGSVGRFHELPLERERSMVELNIVCLHELTGAFVGPMVERGAGAILNLASTASFQPVPGLATYAATKAFVGSFSEAVHEELSGTGVSVTALCPGPTHTEFGARAGVGGLVESAPEFMYSSAPDVARQGVDAMVTGRRSVIPGLSNKASAFGGRFVPRSLLLPALGRLGGARIASAASEKADG